VLTVVPPVDLEGSLPKMPDTATNRPTLDIIVPEPVNRSK